MVLYVDLSRAIWKSSGMSQHSMVSKIGLKNLSFLDLLEMLHIFLVNKKGSNKGVKLKAEF